MGQEAFVWWVVGGSVVGLIVIALVGTITNWWLDFKGDD
jgi:hypothetical protein